MIRIYQLKPKKCQSCRSEYQPVSRFQKACSPQCALSIVRQSRINDQAKANRVERVRLKTRIQWLREAQNAFNQFIKLRDEKLPCISCGRFHEGQWHAGHYRTTKAAPELRFDEDNCHKQCQPCNTHLSGNIPNYRLVLLMRIGHDRVDRLESFHESRKYTIEELQQIKKTYQLKVKALRQAK